MPQQKKARNYELTRRFLPYYRRYWKLLVFDLLCASLTTVCDLVLPMIVRYITNTGMTDLAALTVSHRAAPGRAVRAAAHHRHRGQLTTCSPSATSWARCMETDMRRDLFAHLQELSHSYYDNTKIGQIMSRITTDLFDVTEFAHHCPEEVLHRRSSRCSPRSSSCARMNVLADADHLHAILPFMLVLLVRISSA